MSTTKFDLRCSLGKHNTHKNKHTHTENRTKHSRKQANQNEANQRQSRERREQRKRETEEREGERGEGRERERLRREERRERRREEDKREEKEKKRNEKRRTKRERRKEKKKTMFKKSKKKWRKREERGERREKKRRERREEREEKKRREEKNKEIEETMKKRREESITQVVSQIVRIIFVPHWSMVSARKILSNDFQESATTPPTQTNSAVFLKVVNFSTFLKSRTDQVPVLDFKKVEKRRRLLRARVQHTQHNTVIFLDIKFVQVTRPVLTERETPCSV